ncbi:acetylglutamate kinase [Domibacillus epiphyticus]|uniref:Acetylglutamate kinase n=1 Tax=Domibacillus epiphyticus TaxID=1714355 RepID=A0A1V2AAJ6_9BACI|nr:acetylglutamate kinase [Domibacillus epiphyticus]OMP68026.1 acetylglutamate kinase [Domibacillus epiphyticus]
MKTVVVKCGGSVLKELSDSFFNSMKSLLSDGYKIVFVHGGGPEINAMLEKMNVKSEFKNGLRVTSKEVLEAAELVLSGSMNRKLVRLLEVRGIATIGLQSSDHGILEADFINQEELGFVGDVTSVNKTVLETLLNIGLLPVLTPIAKGPDGSVLNVNADHAAGAAAHALAAEHLLMVTDVDGVLNNGQLVPELTGSQTQELINTGVISGGMIPKVNTALKALESCGHVHIVSGKKPFYENGKWYGTQFNKEEEEN